jgi:hypothetical protein
MKNKETAVVFDTNSYRNFVKGKAPEEVLKATEELKSAEKKKNILAFGITVVGLEMIANITEGENGFNYNDCLNGLISMSNHCYSDVDKEPRIVPPPYLHLTRSFFNTIPEAYENGVKNIGGVIHDFKLDYKKALEHHNNHSTFINVKSYFEKEELQFASEISKLIDSAKEDIRKKYPRIDARQFRTKILDFILNGPYLPLIALAIIIEIAESLQINLPKDELINRAKAMDQEFPLSVGFYKWISYKIVEGNINMQSKTSKEKRWNWLWDYQVTFLINEHKIDNKEVMLITYDKDIIEMLKNFGYKNKVLTLSEYLDYLKK